MVNTYFFHFSNLVFSDLIKYIVQCTYCIFAFTAATVFNAARDVDFKVKLKDSNNIALTKENFNKIIDYYSHCACFHVKFYLDTKIMPEIIITPEVSTYYIFIRFNVNKLKFISKFNRYI